MQPLVHPKARATMVAVVAQLAVRGVDVVRGMIGVGYANAVDGQREAPLAVEVIGVIVHHRFRAELGV